MTKNKKNNSLYTIGFIIVILILLGVYYSVYSKDSNNDSSITNSNISEENNEQTANSQISAEENKQLGFSGTIYYTKDIDGKHEIYSQKDSEDPKLLFTDADEDEKIKFANSMTNSAKFLALIAPESEEFGGALYLINSDGSGDKQKIIDQFASPQPPVISPDGENIAYVLFSNAEMEYGFSLYIMNSNGENKVKIDTDSTMISNPVYDQDVKNIAYLKNNEIISSNLDGSEKNTIYELNTNDQLMSINWNNEKNILLVIKNNNTKIVSVNPQTKQSKTLYEDTDLIDATYVDSEGETLVFINNNSNHLEMINSKDDKKELIEATGIIRWLK